jgi:hypothetical protein
MGSIVLNNPIEIADINSEFQRASRDDHAVLCLGERLFEDRRSSALSCKTGNYLRSDDT